MNQSRMISSQVNNNLIQYRLEKKIEHSNKCHTLDGFSPVESCFGGSHIMTIVTYNNTMSLPFASLSFSYLLINNVGNNPKLRNYVCHHLVHTEKFDRMNDGTPDKMIGKKEIRNLDMRLSHEDCDHHQHHGDF